MIAEIQTKNKLATKKRSEKQSQSDSVKKTAHYVGIS